MKEKQRHLMIPVICLLLVVGITILGQFKEEPFFGIDPPDSPPTGQAAMEDGKFTWDQTVDIYSLRLENTGECSVTACIKYGFPWPGYLLTMAPGEHWELTVENAHSRPHTITFETEESTPSGTVEVWSITQ